MKSPNHAISILILTFTITIFSGCAPFVIRMEKILTIEKGMTTEGIRKMLGKKPASDFSIIDSSGTECRVLVYFMHVDDLHVGTDDVMLPGPDLFPLVFPIPEYLQVFNDYYFIFRDNILIYWCFLNELTQAENEHLRKLAPQIARMRKPIGYLRAGMDDIEVDLACFKEPRDSFDVENQAGEKGKLIYFLVGPRGAYIIYFRNNKLAFDGFPPDFARSDDPEINYIGKKATKIVKADMYKVK